MMDLHFADNGNNSYDVQNWKDGAGYDWDDLGTLECSDDRGVWTLWFPGYDDGVDFYESLQETESEIKLEYLNN